MIRLVELIMTRNKYSHYIKVAKYITGPTLEDVIKTSGLLQCRTPRAAVVAFHGNEFMSVPQNCSIANNLRAQDYIQVPTHESLR